ncbi:steroid delta-isomerase-like uncharacterized protein [Roseiarcus fermentans]|uniref:Steroid delta-isomerase-like uncharacterized protein n=1 Tax=Roseiarcus fermentans TaxID=1473586 RepID=A0A366FIG8_9HYPH|nr:ester cyclase [Roseiarcus fermentans]RBP14381.1 steroid delta-isomerase-like uncharacterized protein [Roseiarcus fermentans]
MRRRTFLTGAAVTAAGPLASGQARAADATMARKFADALSAHDIDAFADLFADDYVNHQVSIAAPPPSGLSAKAATVAFFAARLKAIPDLAVSLETTVAEDDRVAASFVYQGRHEGVYYGVEPTGRRLWFTSCDIFRIANGRIVEHWGMGDLAGIVAQLKG